MTANTEMQDEFQPVPPASHKHVTLLAFVCLLLSVSLLLALFIIYKYNRTPESSVSRSTDGQSTFNKPVTGVPGVSKTTPTVAPVSKNAQTVLSFNPAATVLNSGKTANINLIVDTGKNLLLGAEFTLKYDPSVIEVVSVTPAGYFDKPTVLMNKSDKQSGTVNYAIGSLTEKSGNGNLITITVKGIREGITDLNFAGTTSLVAKGETGNVLKNVTKAVINVN